MTLTTFLEAVNQMLRMMGEAPVNSLDSLDAPASVAQQAKDLLQITSRAMQSEGWSFNTDRQITLVRAAVTDNIVLAPNVSKVVVDQLQYPDLDVVQRGNRLYDRQGSTYVFPYDLVADVTWLLEWEELPEYARFYISIKAGRALQEAIVGDVNLTKIHMAQEAEARASFMEQEASTSRPNILRGDPNQCSPLITFKPHRALQR
jgi:hypothetical protein